MQKKLKLQNYSTESSIKKATEHFRVEKKSIRKWRKQLSELTKVSIKSKTKTLHKWKMGNTKNIEDELVEWILMNLSLSIPIISWEVIIKVRDLDESLKLKHVNSLQKRCYRFFEVILAEFSFMYSCWPETTKVLPKINQKVN